MQPIAEVLVDRIATVLRQRLPPGVTPAYFDGFLRRNRPVLVAVLDRQLATRRTAALSSGDRYAEAYAQPPDLWSASQRTAANLAAMRVAASKRPDEMTAQDRAALAAYSGWGGLSILSAAAQFPTGFPVPEERGLIQQKLPLGNYGDLSNPNAMVKVQPRSMAARPAPDPPAARRFRRSARAA